MAKKKYIRRNYDKKTYFKGDFSASRLEEFEETLALISSKYKYVRFGITTDLKEEYDLRKSHDNISWSKMVLLYTTPSTLESEYFYVHTKNKENYIANNKLKFPLTLFDKYEKFYIYVMVGRRKKVIKIKNFTFIDLFAGLGGFHSALSALGGKCVFASELKSDLQDLYRINFPNVPIVGDITTYPLETIPQHDVLCAGFPCQPFSQAGKRQGFNDEKDRGNMFNYICKIIKAQGENKPKYILLENVSNLLGHDGGNTWKVIEHCLSAKDEEGGLDYDISARILSPHEFGFPQHRRRLYIVGIRRDMGGLKDFQFPEPTNELCDIRDVIDENDKDIQPLSLKTHMQLKVWQKFLDDCKKSNVSVPGFPIWAMEFGATYPFETVAPAYSTVEKLVGERGKLGKEITCNRLEECIEQLPVYAQTAKDKVFPYWKIKYIQQNRNFFTLNKSWLSKWLPLIQDFDNSHMKLEWNCGEEYDLNIKNKIVQYRASGIRVKAPTFSPALNLVGTQVPIVPWVKLPKKCIPSYTDEELSKYGLTQEDIKYGRYMSIKECARLQGMEKLKFGKDEFRLSNTRIYEALGNAVNVNIVKLIARNLIRI